MANAILDGAGRALGLPAAGALIAALAGQLYLWSFGPYGWTREMPVCPQVETCVIVAGLDGDVSYGFGAGGNVFGVDFDDDVTERLVSRLGAVARRDRTETVSILKYTREVHLPEAGDAREQDRFFGSLAQARQIGATSRAQMVVIGRVVGDDVIIWFVDPHSDDSPRQADYSMTAPDAQQNLARSFDEALTLGREAGARRAQAATEAERASEQERARQRARQAESAPIPANPQTNAPAPQNYAANTAPSSSIPGRAGPPPAQAPAARPPQVQSPQPRRPEATSTPAPVQPATQAPPAPATPAVALPNGTFVYQCTDQRVLRVVFDNEDRTAVVTQYGRAPTRLRLASAESPFRFARSGYELSGTTSEVRWRIGSGDPIVCARRSW